MKLKKFLICVIFCLAFLLGVANVSAKKISIDDVVNTFNESKLSIDNGLWCDGKVRIEIGEVASFDSLLVKCEKSPYFEREDETTFLALDYDVDVIRYLADDVVITEENHAESHAAYYREFGIVMNELLDSILKLSNYEKMGLTKTSYTETAISTYGLYISGEGLSTTAEYRNIPRTAGVINLALFEPHEFKISLDTDKIDALVKEYGDPYIRTLITLTPTVEVKDVTDSTVTLLPKIDYKITDPDYKYSFYVYECNESNCNAIDYKADGDYLIISNLEENTKHTYKVILSGSSIYSDIIEVGTTSKNQSANPGKENPNTGAFLPVFMAPLLLGAFAVLFYTKTKDRL